MYSWLMCAVLPSCIAEPGGDTQTCRSEIAFITRILVFTNRAACRWPAHRARGFRDASPQVCFEASPFEDDAMTSSAAGRPGVVL
jgi:hypothetical protein